MFGYLADSTRLRGVAAVGLGFVHLLSGTRKGTRMATYIMAGQAGQAVGPLLAVFVAVYAPFLFRARGAPATAGAAAITAMILSSMASGLMLGVSMGIGGLLVGPVSALAQVFGLIPVLTVRVSCRCREAS